MENIKEELRQLIKEKILSTIMEGKKSEKPVHPPSGASHQRPKSWSGKVKSGSEGKKQRREGKKQAQEMSESRETEKSIPYNKLTVSDLFRRYQEITKPK